MVEHSTESTLCLHINRQLPSVSVCTRQCTLICCNLETIATPDREVVNVLPYEFVQAKRLLKKEKVGKKFLKKLRKSRRVACYNESTKAQSPCHRNDVTLCAIAMLTLTFLILRIKLATGLYEGLCKTCSW